MEKSENESDSSGDYVDATENLVSYSDEMYGITVDKIQKHMELLKDRLQDTKFGILDKLLANDGLTYQETTAIQNCSKNPYNRSKKLIDVVLEKNIVSEFIKALVDTGQKHLVNYLRGDGVYSAEFGDDWPLGDDRIKQLNVNQEHLINNIEPYSGLIHILYSARVLNQRQFCVISEKRDCIVTNEALLNIIRQQSINDYNSTISCLSRSGQPHIAEILRQSGVIQRIRVSQEGDPAKVSRTENTISDQIANLLLGLSIEERQRELQLVEIKLLAAKKGESIYLYVYCATLEELTELHNLLVTDAVKTIVETLFNKFVSRQDRIVVSYTYSEEEYVKCKSYFEEIGSTFSESLAASEEVPGSQAAASMDADIQKLRENRVTSDVFRVNLERHRVFVEGRMDPDHGLVYRLQETDAIDYNEVQIICAEKVPLMKSRKILDIILEGNSSEKIKKFCQSLRDTKQQHLLNYVEANGDYKTQFVGDWPLTERETNIFDKNLSYLKQRIDTAGGLLADMRRHNTITRWQEERVSEHTNRFERNAALLKIIRRGSLSEYKNTIDRLAETKQEHIAAILREGFAGEKIHPSATEEISIKNWTTQMLNEFKELKPTEKARLLESLHDVSDGKIIIALLARFPSAEAVGKQGISKNRTEMKSTYPENPVAPEEMKSTHPDSPAAPVEMKSTDPESRTPPVVEINENTLNNVAIPEINKVLVDRMNPDFGILDKLLALKALSRAEIAEVKKLGTSHEKNSQLLELVTKKEKLTELFNALKDTHQEHLVNYVTAKGEYSQEYGGDWPLMERETSILDVNQEALLDILDFTGDEIVNKLLALKVLNRRQKMFICMQSYDYEKAEILLGFLYRSSLSDYSKMIACLRDSNQRRAATILADGGALVRVHNAVAGETDAVTRVENEIVERIENILSNMNLEELSRFMERFQLKVFAARVGH